MFASTCHVTLLTPRTFPCPAAGSPLSPRPLPSTSSSHLCGISGTMAGTMAAASAPHFTLFVGDVSLSAATKSFVKRLRRRRLSQFQSYCLSRSLSLFHLQFLSPTPPPSHSTSPLDCCNCLSFQIVSCAKAQSQKLAQLIHEISRFISPSFRTLPRPPSPRLYLY